MTTPDTVIIVEKDFIDAEQTHAITKCKIEILANATVLMLLTTTNPEVSKSLNEAGIPAHSRPNFAVVDISDKGSLVTISEALAHLNKNQFLSDNLLQAILNGFPDVSAIDSPLIRAVVADLKSVYTEQACKPVKLEAAAKDSKISFTFFKASDEDLFDLLRVQRSEDVLTAVKSRASFIVPNLEEKMREMERFMRNK